MIVADGKGGSWMKKFAIADDFEESDGRSVLDFWQAQKQARLLARGGHDGESDYGKPATVGEALDSYEKDLVARGGMIFYPKRLRKVLAPSVLTKPVALLTAKELSALRDDFGKGLKPASVNRHCADGRAQSCGQPRRTDHQQQSLEDCSEAIAGRAPCSQRHP
jgi:hypothetical protein